MDSEMGCSDARRQACDRDDTLHQRAVVVGSQPQSVSRQFGGIVDQSQATLMTHSRRPTQRQHAADVLLADVEVDVRRRRAAERHTSQQSRHVLGVDELRRAN